MNSTYFGPLAEFGEADVLLARVAPKYFGLSFEEARRRASGQALPCRVFRLRRGKSPWLVSVIDLAGMLVNQRESDQAPRRFMTDRNSSSLDSIEELGQELFVLWQMRALRLLPADNRP